RGRVGRLRAVRGPRRLAGRERLPRRGAERVARRVPDIDRRGAGRGGTGGGGRGPAGLLGDPGRGGVRLGGGAPPGGAGGGGGRARGDVPAPQRVPGERRRGGRALRGGGPGGAADRRVQQPVRHAGRPDAGAAGPDRGRGTGGGRGEGVLRRRAPPVPD